MTVERFEDDDHGYDGWLIRVDGWGDTQGTDLA
jgi:hypothetical protein